MQQAVAHSVDPRTRPRMPRRLLWIAGNFPRAAEPGRGVFNLRMAQALAGDHELDVVSPVPWVNAMGDGIGPGKLSDGLRVHYPRFWYVPKLLHQHHGSFLWWSIRRTIRRILETAAPDAVLGYWAHPDGEAAIRAAQMVNVPAVVMVGGSDVLLLAREPARRRCIQRVLREADAVVAVSHDLREKVIALGVDPDAVHVVPRGVDHTRFAPGNQDESRRRLRLPLNRPILLWVGRMVPVKGLDVLIAACKRLVDRGTTFHLCLIGDGPLRPSLEQTCMAAGLSERVTFVGAVTQHDLPNWYRAADVTMLPSRSEGIPNVLRESLACGTPFVASRVGGIVEIADESACRLVPPDKPAELADAITDVLAQPRSKAGVSVPLPSWDDAADSLMQIVDGLIANRTTGRRSHAAA
jgi:teichuronic acid biosynthesis glycosyltransferase TuaC